MAAPHVQRVWRALCMGSSGWSHYGNQMIRASISGEPQGVNELKEEQKREGSEETRERDKSWGRS